MPPNPIATLEDTARRLLLAGAPLARTDDALAAHEGALASLATTVPALLALARQTRRAVDAEPAAAAAELLTLAALASRAVRAQAHAAAPPGELDAPAATSAQDAFGCADDVVIDAYEALACEGHGRRERLEALVRAGLGNDVRLVPGWIRATDHASIAWQAVAVLAVMPRAWVRAPLEAAFDLAGGPGNEARLEALVRLLPRDEAIALAVRAAEHGSSHVAPHALALLKTLDPVAAERVAASLATHPRATYGQRYAAIASLSTATSPAAMSALVGMLGDADRHVADYAQRTLGGMPNALVDPAVRAALVTLLARIAAPYPHDARMARAGIELLEAHASIRGGSDEALLAGLFLGTTDEPLQTAAARGLLHIGTNSALVCIAGETSSTSDALASVGIDAAIALGVDEAWARLGPLCAPTALGTPAGLARAGLAMDRLALAHAAAGETATLDARWFAPAVGLVARLPDGSRARAATRELLRASCAAAWTAGGVDTLPSLAALLAVDDEARWYALPVLARLGGEPAAARIVAATGLTGTALRARCVAMLRDLAFERAWFELRCAAVDRNCDKVFSPGDRDAIRALCEPAR